MLLTNEGGKWVPHGLDCPIPLPFIPPSHHIFILDFIILGLFFLDPIDIQINAASPLHSESLICCDLLKDTNA